jgi:hypothetical protein
MISFQYYHTSVLIAIIFFSGSGLAYFKENIGYQFSIISAIGILLNIINKFLWKYPLFIKLFWIKDFSGRYEGELEYEYRDENCEVLKGKLKHIKIISQTGGKITVYSITISDENVKSSVSQSLGVHVELTQDDIHYNLIYSYRNEGNNELKFPPHYGTDIIKFIKRGNDKFLEGKYFTERLPFQSKGHYLNLKWVSDNLEHDF